MRAGAWRVLPGIQCGSDEHDASHASTSASAALRLHASPALEGVHGSMAVLDCTRIVLPCAAAGGTNLSRASRAGARWRPARRQCAPVASKECSPARSRTRAELRAPWRSFREAPCTKSAPQVRPRAPSCSSSSLTPTNWAAYRSRFAAPSCHRGCARCACRRAAVGPVRRPEGDSSLGSHSSGVSRSQQPRCTHLARRMIWQAESPSVLAPKLAQPSNRRSVLVDYFQGDHRPVVTILIHRRV